MSLLASHHRNILPAWQHRSCSSGCTAMTQHYCLCLLRCILLREFRIILNDTTQQTQAIMFRHCNTTTATGPMLPCRQDAAMMQQQEKHTEINSHDMNFILLQFKEQVVLLTFYFAARKTTQHKLPQLKLGPTIYAIGLPVVTLCQSRLLQCFLSCS